VSATTTGEEEDRLSYVESLRDAAVQRCWDRRRGVSHEALAVRLRAVEEAERAVAAKEPGAREGLRSALLDLASAAFELTAWMPGPTVRVRTEGLTSGEVEGMAQDTGQRLLEVAAWPRATPGHCPASRSAAAAELAGDLPKLG
jgi:hypothetical protein